MGAGFVAASPLIGARTLFGGWPVADKHINPMLKTALELGPIVAFFVAYLMFKDETITIGGLERKGFVIVTLGFIPLLLASMGALWWLTGKLSRMQVVTAVLVVVFGALTVWFNDPQFLMIKVTLIYLLFGSILLVGLLMGRSYLQYVMEEVMPLKHEGWMLLTKRITALFFAMAVLNEIVWRFMGEETWVYFKTFGLTAAVFLFFMTQGGLFQKYSIDEGEEQG
jgi:intracellular septation protein